MTTSTLCFDAYRGFKAFLILAGVLLACVFTTPGFAAPRLEPCHVDGVRESLRCGHVQVPEVAGGDRLIDIRVVILAATQPDPLPDPLVILAGGPGQAASEMAGTIRAAFSDVHESRDIVLIDQRGTGASNPLGCPVSEDAAVFRSVDVSAAAARSCLETLEAKADLSVYSTYHAADDLERVRQAFGWPQINLWGGSYGSRLALVYQDRHPQNVRSMVIDAVAPYSLRLPLPNAASAQRAFDLLAEDCAADAECHAAFPDPEGDLAALLEAAEAGIGRQSIQHPRTGSTLDFEPSTATFANAVRAILYESRRASLLPHLLRRAALGDYAPLLAAAFEISSQALDTMDLGLTYTVLCSEDLSRIDEAEVDGATAGTFAGRGEFDAFKAICEDWPKTDLPAGFDRLSPRQTPALLLSGALDPVTPPSWAEQTLELLPNGRHLVAGGVGHIASFSGCAPRLIAEFLDAASVQDLDASCLENLHRPPFVLTPAGPDLGSSRGAEP